MEQFKALALVVVVIISLNSCKGTQNSNMNINCNEIVFYNSSHQISFKTKNCVFNSSENGFELTILNDSDIQKLKRIDNPIAEFYLGKTKHIAKGNNLFSSEVPLNVDYFFPLNQSNKIEFFKDTVITFRKIKQNK